MTGWQKILRWKYAQELGPAGSLICNFQVSAFVSQSCGRLIRSDFIPSWDQIFVKLGTRRNSELCAQCRENAFQVKSNVFMSPQKCLSTCSYTRWKCPWQSLGWKYTAVNRFVQGRRRLWMWGVISLPGCLVQMFSLPKSHHTCQPPSPPFWWRAKARHPAYHRQLVQIQGKQISVDYFSLQRY